MDIVVLDMPLLDTRRRKDLLGTFVSDIILQVLSFVAENERSNIRQRQAEGIAAAQARGVKFGRPLAPLPEQFEEIYCQWNDREISLRQAAERCEIPMGTLYGQFRRKTDCNYRRKNDPDSAKAPRGGRRAHKSG